MTGYIGVSNILNLITTAVLGGTLVITPLLIVVHLFKIRLHRIDKQVLIQSVNTCLLIASTIFLISLIAEFFTAFYSQTDYQQYAFVNRYTGSLWYVGIAEVISKLSLPQLFWVKRFRRSITASIYYFCIRVFLQIVVILIMFVSSLVLFKSVSYGAAYRLSYPWSDLLIYIVILTTAYFIINRKTKIQAKPVV